MDMEIPHLRVDTINRIEAKTVKTTLSKSNLDMFARMTNRRDIRNSNVRKLLRVLEKGKNFETPFATSKKGGIHYLLDGNHRFEAITEYLDKYPQRKVEVAIFSYENLTPVEEKEMYTKWNSGTKQNTNDFIKQYWDSIPITAMMVAEDFPVRVNHKWIKNEPAIEFKILVSEYICRNKKKFEGGFQGSATDFVEEAKKLNEDDYNYIKAYLKEYIEIFGVPNNENMHYSQAPFFALMRIWYDNVAVKGISKIKKEFIKMRGGPNIVNYVKGGGTREQCMKCRDAILASINGKRSVNVFI
jgi:hypothetical protein